MKLLQLAMVFIILVIPFSVEQIIKTNHLSNTAYQQLVLDQIVDTAIEDAMTGLVMRGNYGEIIFSKEMAKEQFFTTLYLNMNAINDATKQAMIRLFVPVMLLVDYDGFYIMSLESYQSGGATYTNHVWSDKIPYTFEAGGAIYHMTMDNVITQYSVSEATIDTLSIHDCLGKEGFPFSHLEHYEAFRIAWITDQIEAAMTAAINQHNDIAKRYGIQYAFHLPTLSEDTWGQCLKNATLLAFVQGIPTGLAGTYYNRYALGGAMIEKSMPYYIQEDSTNQRPYYHRSDCTHLTQRDWPALSRPDAAKQGAFPCQTCGGRSSPMGP